MIAFLVDQNFNVLYHRRIVHEWNPPHLTRSAPAFRPLRPVCWRAGMAER